MQRGFTLIELVMILTLIAILAVAAIPLFSGYGAAKQGNAVLKIASDIRYAQNRATTTQKRSQVSFTANGYTINFCANYTISTCTCPAWSPVKSIDLSTDFSGVTIATIVGHCIEFDSLGKPYYNAGCANPAALCTTSATATVDVVYGGSPKPITVSAETGMVSY